jgi:hypothetical protein
MTVGDTVLNGAWRLFKTKSTLVPSWIGMLSVQRDTSGWSRRGIFVSTSAGLTRTHDPMVSGRCATPPRLL